MTTNTVLREAVERTIERMGEHASLRRALAETRVAPPRLVHLVASWEVSGKLDLMLKRATRLEI